MPEEEVEVRRQSEASNRPPLQPPKVAPSPFAKEGQEDGIKRTKHRSPNYPMIGLRKAVERAQEFHKKYQRSLVPVHFVHTLWGYKPHSGAGNQCIAALKSFGLVEVEGAEKNRRMKISDDGYRVVLNSPDRGEILKKAVLGPSIYAELWKKYDGNDLPPAELIKHYLVFDRKEGTFNPDSVGSFISTFRDSFRFAGLLRDDIISDAGEQDVAGAIFNEELPTTSIAVGDFVQWTSAGVDQFTEPRRVIEITDDEQWAFVEGSATGVPMNELSVQKPKSGPAPRVNVAPPPNPHYAPPPPPGATSQLKPGTVEDKTNLDEGPVVLHWPDDLSPASVEELEYWFAGLIRRARRKAGLPRPSSQPQ